MEVGMWEERRKYERQLMDALGLFDDEHLRALADSYNIDLPQLERPILIDRIAATLAARKYPPPWRTTMSSPAAGPMRGVSPMQ
jgi:hypothetical protein